MPRHRIVGIKTCVPTYFVIAQLAHGSFRFRHLSCFRSSSYTSSINTNNVCSSSCPIHPSRRPCSICMSLFCFRNLSTIAKLGLTLQVMFGRFYSPDSRVEGATGSSKGFSQKEQAEEGQYIKRKENERLKEAKEKLKQAQAEVVSSGLSPETHYCIPSLLCFLRLPLAKIFLRGINLLRKGGGAESAGMRKALFSEGR